MNEVYIKILDLILENNDLNDNELALILDTDILTIYKKAKENR